MKKIFLLILLTTISLYFCSEETPRNFGGDGHDKIAYKLISLRSKLTKESLENLKNYALSIDNYLKNGQQMDGGIHDYINDLSKEDLTKWILNSCLKKKELLDLEKFNEITEEKKSVQTEKIKKIKKPEISLLSAVPKKFGGLHDYIWRMDNDTLIRWALTANAHNNLMTKEQNELDTSKMSVKELIDFILKMVEKYPGLDSSTELDRLGEKYAIKTVKPFGQFGGLHDYLYRMPRNTLIRWALTAEAHERKIKEIKAFGGLHDYIDSLSDVEIANYIAEKAKLYKELDSGEKLDSLAKEYSINFKPSPHLVKFGGLHDYIFRQDRETLIKWALTAEAHDRYERKLNIKGGLHDYIKTLSNEKIAEYVLGMAAVYPVLNSAENLNSLMVKYEIKVDNFNKEKEMKFLQ